MKRLKGPGCTTTTLQCRKSFRHGLQDSPTMVDHMAAVARIAVPSERRQSSSGRMSTATSNSSSFALKCQTVSSEDIILSLT